MCGGSIGFFSVLHTWNQKLLHHPHVHCVVPAGGLSPDHIRWIAARPDFFLPVRVLSRVLALDEFLRRFFLHVLPRGFVRIRHFGFLAHRRRTALLPLCFMLLGQTGDSQTITDATPTDAPRPLWLCPHCGGAMAIVERFTSSQTRLRSPPVKIE